MTIEANLVIRDILADVSVEQSLKDYLTDERKTYVPQDPELVTLRTTIKDTTATTAARRAAINRLVEISREPDDEEFAGLSP